MKFHFSFNPRLLPFRISPKHSFVHRNKLVGVHNAFSFKFGLISRLAIASKWLLWS